MYIFWAWTSNKFERKAPWTNQLILYGIFRLELWWFSKQMAHFSQVAAAQTALRMNHVEAHLLQMTSEIKQIMVLVKLPKFLHLHIYLLAKYYGESHRGSWVSSRFAFLQSTLMATLQALLRNISQWISCSHFQHFLSCAVLCLHYFCELFWLNTEVGKVRLFYYFRNRISLIFCSSIKIVKEFIMCQEVFTA